MLSDTGITIAGHAVTSFQLLGFGALLLCVAAILIGHRKDLHATVRQSAVTDRLAADLGRIAMALERLANQASDASGETVRTAAARRAEARAEAREAEVRAAEAVAASEPAGEEAHRVAYSIFGR